MQGSIQKRVGKRGNSWRVRYDVPQPDGSRKQVSETVATKREAEALLTRRMHEMHTGAYAPPSTLTVTDLLDRWLAPHAARLSPASVHRYRRAAATHVRPALGAVPIGRLTTLAIQDFYGRLHSSGVRPAGVRMVHKVLDGALKQAVAWQMLARNPADGVTLPRATPSELTFWGAREAAVFLTFTDADPVWGAFFRTAIHTGMRRGELLVLRWADVDLSTWNAVWRRLGAR